jgi:hypothetical protein
MYIQAIIPRFHDQETTRLSRKQKFLHHIYRTFVGAYVDPTESSPHHYAPFTHTDSIRMGWRCQIGYDSNALHLRVFQSMSFARFPITWKYTDIGRLSLFLPTKICV